MSLPGHRILAPSVLKNTPFPPHVMLLCTCPRRCDPFVPKTRSSNSNSMISLPSFYQFVLFALADTNTTSLGARQHVPGTTSMTPFPSMWAPRSTPNPESYFVPNGNRREAVPTHTNPSTYARDVAPSPMEPSAAPELRTLSPPMPYKADSWKHALHEAGLFICFIQVPSGICNGFLIDFPTLSSTQSPPNKDSVLMYADKFQKMIDHELIKRRYIGPFSQSQLLALLGPFQSSPISIIPKPGRPGKFRIVQNFSFPISPSARYPNPSINSYINAVNFPTLWGTFFIVYLLISRLPPSSEAETWDVAEAYHTIPLHPSQWSAAVVRANHNDLYVDTCAAFGTTPSTGVYGHVADAGTEIFRSQRIGPMDKWVDNHIFLCIRSIHLGGYNTSQNQWSQHIDNAGGIKQSGS